MRHAGGQELRSVFGAAGWVLTSVQAVKEATFLQVKGLLYSWLLIMCLPSEVGCLIDICKPSTVCICILEHHSGRTYSKKRGVGLFWRWGYLNLMQVPVGFVHIYRLILTDFFFSVAARRRRQLALRSPGRAHNKGGGGGQVLGSVMHSWVN